MLTALDKGYKLETAEQLENMLRDWKQFNNSMLHFMKDFDLLISPAVVSPALHFGEAQDFMKIM